MTQNNLIWPLTAESDNMMNQSEFKAEQAVRARRGKGGKTRVLHVIFDFGFMHLWLANSDWIEYCMASFIQERGAVTSFLVRSTPHRAALIRALADGIALCSWAIHFILTVPLST